jgi:DNA-binding NtrC family response regulator
MSSARVLLVEDEGLIRMTSADILQEEGFEIVEARDGDEAVRLIEQSPEFDVLFTDLAMPGTRDGVDVAFCARERWPAIGVLIVSGYAPHIMSRIAVLKPPAVFASKPYNMTEIVEIILRLTAKILK